MGVQYSLPLGGYGAVISPRLDLFYQGARTNGTENLPQLTQGNYAPAYALANAATHLRIERRKMERGNERGEPAQ